MNNVIITRNGSKLKLEVNDYPGLVRNLTLFHDNALAEVSGIFTKYVNDFLNPPKYQDAVNILLNIPQVFVLTKNFNKLREADPLAAALEEIDGEICKISVHDSVEDFAKYRWGNTGAAPHIFTAYMPKEPYKIYREFYPFVCPYYVTDTGQVVMFWRA